LKEAPSISEQQEGLPEALDTVFAKAFAKDADDRYESVAEFLGDCERARIGEDIVGKAPAAYKGAIRKFHAGGAKGAVKLLVAMALIVGVGGALSFGLWSEWQAREKTQRAQAQLTKIKSALSQKISRDRFEADFRREFERRLLEKLTGEQTEIVRPDYLIDSQELLSIKKDIVSLDIEKALKDRLSARQRKLAKFTDIWALLESLTINPSSSVNVKVDEEWSLLAKPYSNLLRVGSLCYRNDWKAADRCLQDYEGKAGSAVQLSHGLIAWKLRDDKRCIEELELYIAGKENPFLRELIDSSRCRYLLSRMFLFKDRLKWKEIYDLFPKKGRSVENSAWRLIKAEIRQKWKALEQSSDKTKLIAQYNDYFEKRAFIPELERWPLNEGLLTVLLEAESKHDSLTPKAFVYWLLLAELNPAAKILKTFRIERSVVELRQDLEGCVVTNFLEQKQRFEVIVLLCRYGIVLEYMDPLVVASCRKAKFLDAPLQKNEADPILRFWRGYAKEEKGVEVILFDAAVEVRDHPGAASRKQAKDAWSLIEYREADLLYSINSGELGPCLRALAISALCTVWENKLMLGIEDDGDKLRGKGIALLSEAVKDHPDPFRALTTLMKFATVNQSSADIKDKYEQWIAESAGYLAEWKADSERQRRGLLYSLRHYTPIYVQRLYLRRMKTINYIKAIHYAKRGQIELSFRFVAEGLSYAYHHDCVTRYVRLIYDRGQLRELETVKEMLVEVRAGKLKEERPKDFKASSSILEDLKNRIRELK
ncbi:MAG: hypothetical protein P1V97_38300, partial [Planctomycetota bacterium]|nr:hypothetical protein [Planctomycetota bacterium]